MSDRTKKIQAANNLLKQIDKAESRSKKRNIIMQDQAKAADRIESQQATIERLIPYLQHTEGTPSTRGCDSLMPTLDPSKPRRKCDCGLNEIRAALKEQEK